MTQVGPIRTLLLDFDLEWERVSFSLVEAMRHELGASGKPHLLSAGGKFICCKKEKTEAEMRVSAVEIQVLFSVTLVYSALPVALPYNLMVMVAASGARLYRFKYWLMA